MYNSVDGCNNRITIGGVSQTGPRGSSVLSGSGAPTSAVGVNGDFYIDLSTYDLYGPKASGAWPTPGLSLQAQDPLYIQDTQPTQPGRFMWIDTSALPAFQVYFEDGL